LRIGLSRLSHRPAASSVDGTALSNVLTVVRGGDNRSNPCRARHTFENMRENPAQPGDVQYREGIPSPPFAAGLFADRVCDPLFFELPSGGARVPARFMWVFCLPVRPEGGQCWPRSKLTPTCTGPIANGSKQSMAPPGCTLCSSPTGPAGSGIPVAAQHVPVSNPRRRTPIVNRGRRGVLDFRRWNRRGWSPARTAGWLKKRAPAVMRKRNRVPS